MTRLKKHRAEELALCRSHPKGADASAMLISLVETAKGN